MFAKSMHTMLTVRGLSTRSRILTPALVSNPDGKYAEKRKRINAALFNYFKLNMLQTSMEGDFYFATFKEAFSFMRKSGDYMHKVARLILSFPLSCSHRISS